MKQRPDDERPMWIVPKIPGTRWLALVGVVLVCLALASAAIQTLRPAPVPGPAAVSQP